MLEKVSEALCTVAVAMRSFGVQYKLREQFDIWFFKLYMQIHGPTTTTRKVGEISDGIARALSSNFEESCGRWDEIM